MAKIRKMLAFLLVLTMIFSLGEVLALAAPVDMVDPDDTTDPSQQTQSTPEPEASSEPSEEPEASPEPSEEPEASPEPSEEPETSPEPSEEPEASPEPSEEPEASPEPSEEPEASPEPSEEPHKQWPWTEPGNTIADLMGGGQMLTSGSDLYSGIGGLHLNGTMLVSAEASDLNLVGGWLYYTASGSIWRIPAGGGSPEMIYTPEAGVSQMYVMGQEIRFLSGGSLFSYDLNDGMVEALEGPAGARKFIPTPYGNLFFTGSLFDYTLWAEQTQLAGGIENAWTENDWLVVVVNSTTKMTSLSGLFAGVYSLQDYSLGSGVSTIAYQSEEQQLAAEAAYLQSAEYAAIVAEVEAGGNGIMPINVYSTVLTKPLNTNQYNIVQRAQQMAEVTWTPLKDRYAWKGDNSNYFSTRGTNYVKDVNGVSSGSVNNNKWGIFLADHTYKGVPYAQCVDGKYVGWGIDLKGFLGAVKDPTSVFYTKYSAYLGQTAPIYGSDCSGFVSYAWDLPGRRTCSSLLNNSTKINSSSYTALQVGYALNNPSSHVMLVTDIGYDEDGDIVSVEITEQTPPKMKVTVFGKTIPGRNSDVQSNLDSLQNSYLNRGYGIYERQCSTRPTVSPVEDVLNIDTPMAPTFTITAVGPQTATVSLTHEKSDAVIYYSTDGQPAKEGSKNTKKYEQPFQITTDTTVTAYAKVGSTDGYVLQETIALTKSEPVLALSGASNSAGVFLYQDKYYVKEGSKLTLLAPNGGTIFYTTDGTEPTAANKASGTVTITPTSGMKVKAFVMEPNCIPGAKKEFEIVFGEMFTVTVNDPYGLVEPVGFTDMGTEVVVTKGAKVEFNVLSEKNGYTLDKLLVDGKEHAAGKITFDDVKENHSIETQVQMPYNDLLDSTGKPGWYTEAVAFTHATGIMNGTTNTTFSPNYGTSRAMFITVLGRYAKYYDSQHGTHLAELYVNTSPVSGAYIEATKLENEYRVGITNGYDINVRTEPTTSRNNIYASLESTGQLVHVVGSQYPTGSKNLWYEIEYKAENGTNTKGYVCQVNPSNGKVLLDVCNFSDITATNLAYCNPWVQWGYLNGLVHGVTSSLFGSTNGITRQDICVILYNFLKNVVGLSDAELNTSPQNFADSGDIASYAKDAVNAMAYIGVLNGDNNNKIQPKAVAWRSQVAQLFMNLDAYLSSR